MVHKLKTWPEYFLLMEKGEKNFELRKNDRGFKAGHKLILEEYDPLTKSYTGQILHKKISYVLQGTCGETFGLKAGYCVLALQD